MPVLYNEPNTNNSRQPSGRRNLKRVYSEEDTEEPPFKNPRISNLFDNIMLNGLRSDQKHHEQIAPNITETPVAGLSNMGNTCYLNSVLYSLRFAPNFLHNLHHLICDLSLANARLSQNKAKTSSLGRNITSLTSSNPHNNSEALPKSKLQIVTETLHELFVNMHNLELKESSSSIQPNAILQAIRDANSILDLGNQQQDVHEVLLYLLDNIRETYDFLSNQLESHPNLLSETEYTSNSSNSGSGKIWGITRSWRRNLGKKDKTKDVNGEAANPKVYSTEFDDVAGRGGGDGGGGGAGVGVGDGVTGEKSRKIGYNFFSADFEGSSLVRTKCLECESTTVRKELFYDIPVPLIHIKDEYVRESHFYRDACVTLEKLGGSNKYFCDVCGRYNEAIREILFDRLPNMMVLQLKRFINSSTGTHKVSTHLPTPLILDCFCESCCKNNVSHFYRLSSIIMHLGETMGSGHYISYVKVSNYFNNYHDCARDLPKTNLSASCSEKSLNIMLKLKLKKTGINGNLIEAKNGIASKSINGLKICKSIDCCGVKVNRNVLEHALNSDLKRNDYEEDLWLECDDDSIRFLNSEELKGILGKKSGSTATPYLLFYTKTSQNYEADFN